MCRMPPASWFDMIYGALTIGEVMIDFTEDHLQTDGYPVMVSHPGGAPANFLATLQKLGGKNGNVRLRWGGCICLLLAQKYASTVFYAMKAGGL